MINFSIWIFFVIQATFCLAATSPYIRCFQRLTRHSIDNTRPMVELFHVTPLNCLNLCILSTNNPSSKDICRSVVYNHLQHSCRLYDHDGTRVPAILHPANGFDYYRRTATTQECQGPAQYMLKIKTRIKNEGFPQSKFKISDFPSPRSFAAKPNEYPVAPIDPNNSVLSDKKFDGQKSTELFNNTYSSTSKEAIQNSRLEYENLLTSHIVRPKKPHHSSKEFSKDATERLREKFQAIAIKLGLRKDSKITPSDLEPIGSFSRSKVIRGTKILKPVVHDSMTHISTKIDKERLSRLLKRFRKIHAISINAITTVKPSLLDNSVDRVTTSRPRHYGVINRADESPNDLNLFASRKSKIPHARVFKNSQEKVNTVHEIFDYPMKLTRNLTPVEKKGKYADVKSDNSESERTSDVITDDKSSEQKYVRQSYSRRREGFGEKSEIETIENRDRKLDESSSRKYGEIKGHPEKPPQCSTSSAYYVVVGNEIILPITVAENSVKVFHGIAIEECASYCSLGEGPKNEKFSCSSMNFFPKMQRCEIYSILAEPHGPGNLIINDDVVYAEKFCLPGNFVQKVKILVSHAQCDPNSHFVLHVQKKIEKNIVRTTFANSITTCLQQCLNALKCKTASFDSTKNKCHLHSSKIADNPKLVEDAEEGWVLIENSCTSQPSTSIKFDPQLESSLYQWSDWSDCKYRVGGHQVRVRTRQCDESCPDRGIQIERCVARRRRMRRV